MKITICFDMDGTIANLYGVQGWLEMLQANDPTPYAIAKPLVRLNVLARKLNTLQRNGYELAVISWLSKNSTTEYDRAVTQAKLNWLAKHLPSVSWNEINIVPYGTPKQNYCKCPLDVLFDDEEQNRENWTGRAFGVENILQVLTDLQGV